MLSSDAPNNFGRNVKNVKKDKRKMTANTKMAALMRGFGEKTGKRPDSRLPLAIVWPEFSVRNGCVLLSAQMEKIHAVKESFEDETSFEAFVNHIHIDGAELDEELRPVEIARAASKIAESWQAKLSRDFSGDEFFIILAFDEERLEATLRFHKIRDSQAPWVNLDGIEQYAEPIMVIRTGAAG
jgi:hypothetical protein